MVSVSAPKPRTAASDFNVKSSPTVASADISTRGAVISTSVSASISSCPSVDELMDNAVSRNRIFSVVVISISSENWK